MDSPGRILVVDDDQGICRACRRALEPHGFFVDVATSLAEGTQKIRETHFDLVLLDVMLPDGRGIDLLHIIQEQDADTVSVIITGYATVELAVSAIKEGAYDFIAKPFDADVLLLTVNQGLEKRRLSIEARRTQTLEREAAELVRDKQEMERLDQMKSTFMLTVAHELRAPVSSGLSLLRTMALGLAGGLNQKQQAILGRIETRLELLMELINDLLDLASSRSIDPQKALIPVALRPILLEVTDRYRELALEKNISLSIEVPEDPMTVLADVEGAARIFSNLIHNAIKYTPDGGEVQLSASVGDGAVEIQLRDTGIGIPEKDLSKLGNEFFRARNTRHSDIGGTGLGLSIVRQNVDRFHGRMSVESTEGLGSTFSVTLPLA